MEMDKRELKLLRLKLRLSQKELGDILGIKRQSVAKIECGLVKLTKENEQKILNYIDKVKIH